MFPERVLFTDTLSNDEIANEPIWRTFDLSGDTIDVKKGDFFVMINLPNPAESDSVILVSDDGQPRWDRCGSRDDDGLHTLFERYGASNNFLVNCSLYYGNGDTTTVIGR